MWVISSFFSITLDVTNKCTSMMESIRFRILQTFSCWLPCTTKMLYPGIKSIIVFAKTCDQYFSIISKTANWLYFKTSVKRLKIRRVQIKQLSLIFYLYIKSSAPIEAMEYFRILFWNKSQFQYAWLTADVTGNLWHLLWHLHNAP